MNVHPDFHSFPGIERTKWAQLPQALGPLLSPPGRWSELETEARLEEENEIVTAYLGSKSVEYQAQLRRVVSKLAPMPAAQKIEIVAPAYNEHESIKGTLEQIARAGRAAAPDVGLAEWGVLVVVNRPLIDDDPQRSSQDFRNLQHTLDHIEQFKLENPDINVQAAILEVPRKVAGVGLARMFGHDLVALRSLSRPLGERDAPMFIQTMDGDTSHLNPQFFRIVFEQLRKEDFRGDYYRQRDQFPVDMMRKFPLLHAFDFMWNDLIAELSRHTDQAWTIGRCTLVSLRAHCAAGGVLPFKLRNGVDEDIRIGTHINLLRKQAGTCAVAGEISEPVLESDPSRALMGMCEVLDATVASQVSGQRPILTRDLHEAARLLKYYRKFHDIHVYDTDAYSQPDGAWLESDEAFGRAIPTVALEMCANSYFHLAHEELFMQKLRALSETAEMMYDLFRTGRHAYSTARDYVCRWKAPKDRINPSTGLPFLTPERIEAVHQESAREACELMCRVLRRQGIECSVDLSVNPHVPATGESDEALPWPIVIHDTSAYRARLSSLLA